MLIGCDFSSSPSKRKPIVVAQGHVNGQRVQLQSLLRFDTLALLFAIGCSNPKRGWAVLICRLVCRVSWCKPLYWPTDWLACMQHFTQHCRAEDIRDTFKAFCDARPVGGKFAHRATDGPAGSSPSMKWVNPPVAFMLHAGVPVLLQAGVTLAGLHAPPKRRRVNVWHSRPIRVCWRVN